MELIDLFSLREQFDKSKIVLAFNGPISQTLLEEIGAALKSHLLKDNQPSQALNVFGVYIELTQNIRNYCISKEFNSQDSSATVVVANDDEDHYIILAGNMVDPDDAEILVNNISHLASMDKAELKAAYKKQLHVPRDKDSSTGAGLGLLEVARRTSKPLVTHLVELDNGKVFFSLLAVI